VHEINRVSSSAGAVFIDVVNLINGAGYAAAEKEKSCCKCESEKVLFILSILRKISTSEKDSVMLY